MSGMRWHLGAGNEDFIDDTTSGGIAINRLIDVESATLIDPEVNLSASDPEPVSSVDIESDWRQGCDQIDNLNSHQTVHMVSHND